MDRIYPSTIRRTYGAGRIDRMFSPFPDEKEKEALPSANKIAAPVQGWRAVFLREAIWYFHFRLENENANKKNPENPVNPVKKYSDRIYRINRMVPTKTSSRPSPVQNNPLNPVNPVKNLLDRIYRIYRML